MAYNPNYDSNKAQALAQGGSIEMSTSNMLLILKNEIQLNQATQVLNTPRYCFTFLRFNYMNIKITMKILRVTLFVLTLGISSSTWAQKTPIGDNSTIVGQIFKLLGHQCNVSQLNESKQIYMFNLSYTVSKVGNSIKVTNFIASGDHEMLSELFIQILVK
ncbi:hypothetical protein ACJVDH_15400 [Pedobacter sp. AW1-32]|uniref:hypothetical protein n=1 Tax=Pedobacter sp. AW1-32 TaxID=3383026 RepID=UPI003FF0777A